MPQITVELNENEVKIVDIVKSGRGYKKKELAIKDIINEYGKHAGIDDIIKKLEGARR